MKMTHLGAALAVTALGLTACSSTASTTASGAPGSTGGTSAAGTTSVVVSFYPIAYLTERIGGDHVSVTSLTKPGQEPHDLELTPKEISTASNAALGIYAKGMQGAVDDAFSSAPPRTVLDVAPAAKLDRTVAQAVAGSGGEEEGHAGDKDPHFWLDPVRYSAVATEIEKGLAKADPAHAADYAKNLSAVTADLSTLDGELASSLKTCTNKNIVTSHAAFGYLAARYGLTQMPIAGISPEQEPEPKQLAQIADFVKKNTVTTIYTETLASPAIAKTVASETGASVAVLDPIEGITDASAAKDYLGLMRANLASLTKGQSCS